jgi:hypothetical protein
VQFARLHGDTRLGEWRLGRFPLVLASVLMFGADSAGVGRRAWEGLHQAVVRSGFGTAPGGQIETGSLVASGRTFGKVVAYSG